MKKKEEENTNYPLSSTKNNNNNNNIRLLPLLSLFLLAGGQIGCRFYLGEANASRIEGRKL
jgi:hypothetical protein